ncbi:MAG: 16S rRNA (cytosine(1402)-N(4))-methyltransferase RsmH [Victivallales bacterium]|jgi:16S rRNA (cytosine1402-N4)-methyltransferase|nr:16S rRNA (cytosine(1402)-N(4))-methyltransferase RsmH [Victivallales bacterium]
MAEAFEHIPVLKEAVLKYLTFPSDRPSRLIDGTVGGGGHSAMLLERYPRLELLGIDRDESALKKAAETLAFAKERVTLIRGNYSEMTQKARQISWDKVDGILLDIGVSSPQIDHPERGFSWRKVGPLDMRMDQRSSLTASRLLNTASEKELEYIMRVYGEVAKSRKIAEAIVKQREAKPFALTNDFAELCDDVLGKSRAGHLPSPTLPFQALRIAVNDELNELSQSLPLATKLLQKSGRIAVICFHSLEDRIVKNFFRDEAASCVCPPGLPICTCSKVQTLKIVTRKAVTASTAELEQNRRSAPAKLRVAEKIIT